MNELLKLIGRIIGPGVELTADTPLLSSGLIDSFKFSELLMLIEDTRSISVDPSEVGTDNFDTPKQIEAYLAKAGV